MPDAGQPGAEPGRGHDGADEGHEDEHRERLLRDEAEIQTHIQHAHTQNQVALQGCVTLSF